MKTPSKLSMLTLLIVFCVNFSAYSGNNTLIVYPTSTPQDLINVQNALDAIEPNGTIILSEGTFDFDNSGVEINKECTLKGKKGSDGELLTTIINGGSVTYYPHYEEKFEITIKSGNVTIKNLLFDESCLLGILLEEFLHGDILITDNIISGSYGINIKNITCEEMIIEKNHFNGYYGIANNYGNLTCEEMIIEKNIFSTDNGISGWNITCEEMIIEKNIFNSYNEGVIVGFCTGEEMIIEKNIFNSLLGIRIWGNTYDEIEINNNTIANQHGSDGYAGIHLPFNDCEFNIKNNEISNYKYGIFGSSGFDNPDVEIKNNTVHVPYFGTGIQLGHSMMGWSNCQVKNNTLKSFEGQDAILGIGSYPYGGNNIIKNNDLSDLRTFQAQVWLLGRNDILKNNTFGFANADIPSPFPYPIVTPSTAVALWSAYFHPDWGNPYPDPTEYNEIKNNDYTNCGLNGWEYDEDDEPYGGCILIFCYPETFTEINGYPEHASGTPNEVRYNYINETDKFPNGSSPESQILVIQSYDEDGNPLVHDNTIVGLDDEKSAELLSGIGEDNALKLISYPNPFTTSTSIEYELNQPVTVRITFYNSFGRVVDIIEEHQQQGLQKVVWTPENLADGVYYFRLEAGKQIASGKVVLMK